ncbi:hypothetical protein [uncultured Methylobacterium sp.]|jgi:hypothetical protein|uniref:hypothetical protein n=1 Tax=uncultured Methylobacterium sp. TaxID=157278 RepID=UPI00262A57E5|nr:hypothetical protein [uncultured Methylobacterium sp.]
MRILVLAAALLGTTVGTNPAHAQSAGALRETPPYFAPQLLFGFHGRAVPEASANPECVYRTEADDYFALIERGAPERGIAVETVTRLTGVQASRFVTAAWSNRSERPDSSDYAELDLVVIRTRADRPGWAQVHFGSVRGEFTCNFAHPVIITAERLQRGLAGRPQPEAWPAGDPYPGMTEGERRSLKLLLGLGNQLKRGDAQERQEALRGYGQLFGEPATPPTPNPRYEPTVEEMQCAMLDPWQRRRDPSCRE